MSLLTRIVMPVATEADAEQTCAALEPHLDEVSSVLAVHVIEKGGGGIDKAPLAKREEDAAEILGIVEETLGENADVETKTAYGTDVVETLFETAEGAEATALVFVAREGGRLVRLLSGDTSMRLVTEGTMPVVALPSR
ncbi:MAG: universal stress protein [Natronomonas sp.]|jgi:nucleotide-binding universal stress UspA family protein|uniref:Universal stress protein n=1 Tax=Natronomonas salsuginis TaxID=2217661 RepID=A0A4U5JDE3_9EURY|nr:MULTISPECIES: universal stress protein [Natronomonas]MDR9430915.1 universal stress protein [Natronomonas sp.]TKR25868.1 universal stress protein [Natronomonas salsuginis]